VRSVPEWVGKTDDSAPPPHVRLRIFDRHGGICHLSGFKIMPGDKWELEHIIAICNGGENKESNLAPAISSFHKAKTRKDRAIKKKNDRVRKKHLGIKSKKRSIAGRKFDGTPVPSRWR
jgi:5-methylcytosine-specific restriction protein A